MVAVLYHHREPRRTMGQLLDLLRPVEDDAVGAEPAPSAHREVEDGAVAGPADVGLGVDALGPPPRRRA
jgi:hypothetical protein